MSGKIGKRDRGSMEFSIKKNGVCGGVLTKRDGDSVKMEDA